MKRKNLPIFLTSVILTLTLIGCTANPPNPSGITESENNSIEPTSGVSVAETYREMAQEFLDDQDYDAAISILEKGIDATGDAELAELLKEALSLQMSTQPTSSPEDIPTSDPEPAPTSAPASAPEGLDEIVGNWQNEEGSLYLFIDYNDDTQSSAYAWLDIGGGLVANLSPDGDGVFSGTLIDNNTSQATGTLTVYRYKYWLEASWEYSDGGVDYLQFYVSDFEW